MSFRVENGEKVQAMLHFRETEDKPLYLFMTTRSGTVKRLPVDQLKNIRQSGIRALTLDEGDQLISVQETDGEQFILIATHDGQAVRFHESDVRPMGRAAVACAASGSGRATMWWAPPGPRRAKPSSPSPSGAMASAPPVEDYRITSRGGLGIRNYMVTDKTGPIVGIKVVDGTEDLLLVTESGILIRTPVQNIRTAGRATQGVIVMRFKTEGDRVISMALADPEGQTPSAEE